MLSLADAPRPGQLGFQDPATEGAYAALELHDWIMAFLLMALWLVYALLGATLVYHTFKALSLTHLRANIQAYRERNCTVVTEDALLEFAWTLYPVLVLLAVGVPSISLIYGLEEVVQAVSLTLRFVGRQWYWVYSYPVLAADGLVSTSVELEATLRDPQDSTFAAAGSRLLASVPLLLPVGLLLQLLVTGEDVIHSLAMPSLGLKLDAVPGRLNTVYILLERSGIFAGQCSELCGAGHALMPIIAAGADGETVIAYLLEELNVTAGYLQAFVGEKSAFLDSAAMEVLFLDEAGCDACQKLRSLRKALVTSEVKPYGDFLFKQCMSKPCPEEALGDGNLDVRKR